MSVTDGDRERAMEDQHLVTWRECDCDWITKFCDENHVKHAVVPGGLLRDHAAALAEEREKARVPFLKLLTLCDAVGGSDHPHAAAYAAVASDVRRAAEETA